MCRCHHTLMDYCGDSLRHLFPAAPPVEADAEKHDQKKKKKSNKPDGKHRSVLTDRNTQQLHGAYREMQRLSQCGLR